MVFDILVTRDTTESCSMVIEAENPEAAEAAAIKRAQIDTDLVWELDDPAPFSTDEPYVTNIEEMD